MADYTVDPNNLDELDTIAQQNRADASVLAGYGGRLVADIPAFPTRLYGLASDILKAGTQATVHQDSDSPVMTMARNALSYFTPAYALRSAFGAGAELPGAQGAKEFTESVDKNADEVGANIAGRKLQPGLIGDNPPIDKIGTALDIMGSMIPITGGPIKAGFEGLKNINTGMKLIDKTVPAITEIASFLTPFIPTNSPKTLLAVNAGLGGGLQVAADAAKNVDKATQVDMDNDPELQAARQQFITQWSSASESLDKQAAEGTDIATHGVGAAYDAKKEADFKHELEQFRAIDWSNPVAIQEGQKKVITAGIPDLGDYKGAAAAVAGIAVAAGVMYHQRAAVNAKMLEWIAGKDFSKAA